MKKTIKLAVVAALALGTTSAFATNGDHLIGLGAKARGMGGVGIAMSHGAESGLSNPALITSVKNTEISFGGTLFMPDVSYDTKVTNNYGGAYGGAPAGTVLASGKSAADMSMIPEVSLATKINDNVYVGLGMWGTAGMGVDYRDEAGMQMVTNLQLMQFGVPIAYTTNGLSLGITPILQYGALDINYDADGNPANAIGQTGAGVAQDFAFGYTLGASYEISGLTLGAVYKSAIEMDYKGQLSAATAPFTDPTFPVFSGVMSDKLEQPAELGFGLAYNMNEHTVAFDYKQINWEDAKGYKDFGWKDQDVYALGYEYNTGKWALRAGYNYAKNPIKDAGAMTLAQGGMTASNYAGNALNMFNLLGFPATVESHYTIGTTYAFNDVMSLDLAYTYAPETSTSLSTMPADTNGDSMPDVDTSTEVKHSQSSISFQVNFTF